MRRLQAIIQIELDKVRESAKTDNSSFKIQTLLWYTYDQLNNI